MHAEEKGFGGFKGLSGSRGLSWSGKAYSGLADGCELDIVKGVADQVLQVCAIGSLGNHPAGAITL